MFDFLRKAVNSLSEKVLSKAKKKEGRELRESSEREEEKKGREVEVKIGLGKRVKALITNKVRIEKKDVEDVLEEFLLDLLEADVPLELAEDLQKELEEALVGREVRKEEVNSFVKENLRKILLDKMEDGYFIIDLILEKLKEKKPVVVLFFGPNGAGKTTLIAKIAYDMKKRGLKVLMIAGDTFRAGAVEQLSEHGKRLRVDVFRKERGAKPSSVIYEGLQKAKDYDLVLVDTAGRQSVNLNLMKELEKIKKVSSPDLSVFVLDSTLGSAAFETLKEYESIVGIDGVVLTKMDLDPKGGVAISVYSSTGKPILGISTGQGYEDLSPFRKEEIVEKILGG